MFTFYNFCIPKNIQNFSQSSEEDTVISEFAGVLYGYILRFPTKMLTSFTSCLSTPAESTPESSPVEICSAKLLPGEKCLDFLPPRQYFITYFTPGKMRHH